MWHISGYWAEGEKVKAGQQNVSRKAKARVAARAALGLAAAPTVQSYVGYAINVALTIVTYRINRLAPS